MSLTPAITLLDIPVHAVTMAETLDRVAQQYVRGTAGIGTDQPWTMLGQYAAATLPACALY